MKDRITRVLRPLRLIAPMLVAYSIVQELRKPKSEREWHGRVLGFVPYDYRPPTIERIKAAVWNPESHHLLSGQAFGLGWTVNLHEVWRLARRWAGSPAA